MAKAGKGKTRRGQKTAVPEPAPIKPFLKGRLGQIAVLSVVGFLAMIGYWISQSPMDKPPAPPAAAIGGPFTLVDHQGRPVTEDYFKGRLMLVYFCYTFCPDVCPATLAELTRVHRTLGEDSPRVQTLFITVDPERDSAARLKDYLSSFHPGMIGLTGPLPEISALALKYGSYFAKQESNAAAEYLMDHTAFTYLLDQEGIVRHLYHFGDGADLIVKGVRQLLNTGP